MKKILFIAILVGASIAAFGQLDTLAVPGQDPNNKGGDSKKAGYIKINSAIEQVNINALDIDTDSARIDTLWFHLLPDTVDMDDYIDSSLFATGMGIVHPSHNDLYIIPNTLGKANLFSRQQDTVTIVGATDKLFKYLGYLTRFNTTEEISSISTFKDDEFVLDDYQNTANVTAFSMTLDLYPNVNDTIDVNNVVVTEVGMTQNTPATSRADIGELALLYLYSSQDNYTQVDSVIMIKIHSKDVGIPADSITAFYAIYNKDDGLEGSERDYFMYSEHGDSYLNGDLEVTGDATFNVAYIDSLNIGEVVYTDTYWDDLRVPLTNTRINPANSEPDFEDIGNGAFAWGFDSDSDSAYVLNFIAQLPHTYKVGSDLEAHIHWTPSTTNTGTVMWKLTYFVAAINGTLTGPSYAWVSDAGDGTAYKHQLAAFGTIDGSGLGISSMIVGNIARVGDRDTYTGSAYGLEIDFHYESDGPGSRDEYVK